MSEQDKPIATYLSNQNSNMQIGDPSKPSELFEFKQFRCQVFTEERDSLLGKIIDSMPPSMQNQFVRVPYVEDSVAEIAARDDEIKQLQARIAQLEGKGGVAEAKPEPQPERNASLGGEVKIESLEKPGVASADPSKNPAPAGTVISGALGSSAVADKPTLAAAQPAQKV